MVCLIIGGPCLIFVADNYIRSEYKNPFRVASAFSYSYMTKDAKHMKSWADKKIYKEIDKLQYSTPVDYHYVDLFGDFELVCSRRLGNTMVCTYALNHLGAPPLFYSAVLKPVGSPSLWERVKDFIYFDIPLGDEFVGFPYHKQRWLVVDFFTNDDFEKYISTHLEKTQAEIAVTLIEQLHIDIDQMENYEDKWSDREKIRQNIEVKELYVDYLKVLDSNNK